MQIDIESTTDRYLAIAVYLIGLIGMGIACLGTVSVFVGANEGNLSVECAIALCFFFGFFWAMFFSMNRLSAKLLAEYNLEEQ